jgi:hypothetical protein
MDPGRLRLGALQRRQQHCREDGDDRNYDQQLNQREAYVALAVRTNRPIF